MTPSKDEEKIYAVVDWAIPEELIEFKERATKDLLEILQQARLEAAREEREKNIDIANHIPLDENHIPAGQYSAKGMDGLVRVIRKGIVEAIRAQRTV